MKVLKTIKLPALKGFGRLLPALVLTWLFIFLLCPNSYAGDAEDLTSAVQKGDISTVQALLAKGADVNAKDANSTTALIQASFYGHLEIVQALLAKGADVNAKDANGATALMAACGKGHLEIVQALLDKGADVNTKHNDGETALMFASEEDHLEIVQALLSKGADVNAKTNNDWTALSLAKAKGHSDVAQLLIKGGAKESGQKGTTIDPIDNLIAALAQQSMWENGVYPIISLPQSATSAEVIDQCIKMVGFDQGHIKKYKIIEIREIDIPNSYPPHYCAALIDSDLGRKIVLFRYENPKVGWWSRVFEVK